MYCFSRSDRENRQPTPFLASTAAVSSNHGRLPGRDVSVVSDVEFSTGTEATFMEEMDVEYVTSVEGNWCARLTSSRVRRKILAHPN